MADWQIGWPAIRWEENGWGGKRFRGLTGGNSPGTHGAASEKRCLPVPHSSGTWEEESGNILLKKNQAWWGEGTEVVRSMCSLKNEVPQKWAQPTPSTCWRSAKWPRRWPRGLMSSLPRYHSSGLNHHHPSFHPTNQAKVSREQIEANHLRQMRKLPGKYYFQFWPPN